MIDYLKLRRQFGVPIGSFQALQHRAASLHVMCQSTRALIYDAARTLGTATEDLACASAKAKASEAAIEVVKESMQMHGAIGFSAESDIALFFRRAVALAASHGSPDVCRADAFAAWQQSS
jgi:alkylation response protein AidB-like acyl-CoA dehydrogenase